MPEMSATHGTCCADCPELKDEPRCVYDRFDEVCDSVGDGENFVEIEGKEHEAELARMTTK